MCVCVFNGSVEDEISLVFTLFFRFVGLGVCDSIFIYFFYLFYFILVYMMEISFNEKGCSVASSPSLLSSCPLRRCALPRC